MNKILIVEDDPMLSEIYQKKFSQEGNFEVLTAISGTEAEEKTRKEKPDLVLLDLVLPEKDGFEILKDLRDDPSLDDVKIVIFSNLSQEEEQQKAKTLGANGFIAKSDFTPQQIVSEVNKIIGEDDSNQKKTESEKVEQEESGEKENKAVKRKKTSKDSDVAVELGFTPKILIVEDEEVFLEVFGIKLKDSGFEVDTASNGGWGLKLADKNKYDAILLDIVMPVLNGVDLIKKLRKKGENKETPVVILSGSIDEQSQRDEVLKAGAVDVLIKTRVTPSQVVDCVKSHIKKQ
jgi:DNA-binding response OmpR family regulator